MKEITKISDKQIKGYYIVSEPGDATRYDYCVLNYGDCFSFAPINSNFRFPQKLNVWDVRFLFNECSSIKSDGVQLSSELIKMAEELSCNPFTLIECIKTIKEITEGIIWK